MYLADGKLTRAELREAVRKTALPLNTDNEPAPYPYPVTAPYTDANVLFEGYGAATPESAKRASDVLLLDAQLPERAFEDAFFALDRQVRDSLYGGYDRDGDAKADSEALAGGLALSVARVGDVTGALKALQKAASLAGAGDAVAEVTDAELRGQYAHTFYLHRRYSETRTVTRRAAWTATSRTCPTSDSSGDLEPCFQSRVTSVVAAFRPLGIFPSEKALEPPLPAGSRGYVDLYLSAETPSVIAPTGVQMATDREIGTGSGPAQPVVASGPEGAACAALGEACAGRSGHSRSRPLVTPSRVSRSRSRWACWGPGRGRSGSRAPTRLG